MLPRPLVDLMFDRIETMRVSIESVCVETGASRTAVNKWRDGTSLPSLQHFDVLLAMGHTFPFLGAHKPFYLGRTTSVLLKAVVKQQCLGNGDLAKLMQVSRVTARKFTNEDYSIRLGTVWPLVRQAGIQFYPLPLEQAWAWHTLRPLVIDKGIFAWNPDEKLGV